MAAVYILSAVFAVIFILLLIRVIVQRKMAYVMEQGRAVFETRTAVLGGVEQTVLLEGARWDLPVMLMLHGGPWGPVIFGEAYRGYYRTLSAHYILVWWDQYGCGKNYSKDVSGDITVQDFGDMTVDLVDAIHEAFPENEIILNGNSFGSYLSMYAAKRRESIISGVINLGPVMNMKQATKNFEKACERYLTAKEKKKLEAAKGKDYITYELILEALTEKYTNCAHYRGREASDGMTLKWMLRLFVSPDYTWQDIFGVLKAASTAGRSYGKLWNSLEKVDVMPVAKTLQIPVLYIQGAEELYVLPGVLEELASERENIRYCKIPYCGHIPTVEAWQRSMEEMLAFSKECCKAGTKPQHPGALL